MHDFPTIGSRTWKKRGYGRRRYVWSKHSDWGAICPPHRARRTATKRTQVERRPRVPVSGRWAHGDYGGKLASQNPVRGSGTIVSRA